MSADAEARIEVKGAQNQSLFREVNERIEDVADAFGPPSSDERAFVCECARAGCTDRMELTAQEYERVRKDPRRFAVVPDLEHVVPAIERVVERHERYWVVEKLGAAASVASQLDTRARAGPAARTTKH